MSEMTTETRPFDSQVNSHAAAQTSGETETQSLPFQAETREILNLMVHSLYSQKEIFLRELISNASDAIDKLRIESFTHKEWELSPAERGILIVPDEKAHTVTISDNGIGMSREDVVKNIGTIAHSGTKEFLRAKREMQEKPELIGQFGVGFYSAFMVADRVTLLTQKAGEKEATFWESDGGGEYKIGTAIRPEGHGTTITLHLKPAGEDEGSQNFVDEWTLRSIIKKYSDFISVPVKLRVKSRPEAPEVGEENKDVTEPKSETTDETVNSQKALWLRSPSEVKPDEYAEFYRQIAHDWSDPFRTIHFRAEGTQEFAALMFIPKEVPYDYNYRETKYGLSLYVRRVFIMGHCEELEPHYLRFVKGVVDSSDLPLNVSREILQKDSQVAQIQKAITSKILSSLKDLLNKERADYETFFTNFGSSLKEGVITDRTQREKLSELLLFKSNTKEGWTTLAEYIERMPHDQKSVYYLSGEAGETLKSSPYLEKLNAKGYEVLFLTDSVDEWLTRELREYKGKKLLSITGDQLDLDSETDKKIKEEEKAKAEEKFGDLKKFIGEALKDQVKEVRFSDRLVDSPVCLVSDSHEASARMERLLESMGKAPTRAKRILEINPNHAVFEKLARLEGTQKQDWIEILYNQALLSEGSAIQDPGKFGRQIANLMVHA